MSLVSCGYLYVVTNPYSTGVLKIGKSVDPLGRVRHLASTGVPGRVLDLQIVWRHEDMHEAERLMHDALAAYRLPKSEWFAVDLVTVERVHAGLDAIVAEVAPEEDPCVQLTLPDAFREPMLRPEDLGNVIVNRRRQLNLTQAELAELAGTSERFIFGLEAGKQTCRMSLVFAVLDVLGLRLSVGRA